MQFQSPAARHGARRIYATDYTEYQEKWATPYTEHTDQVLPRYS